MQELEKIIAELKGKVIPGIYKITNPKGSVYVGSAVSIRKRFSNYLRLECKGQVKLFRSFTKYGINNHLFEILEECYGEDKFLLEQQLNEREIHWGILLDATSVNNLTLRLGRTKGVTSQETKDKISKANKGKVGKPMSDKHKSIISKANKGKPTWNTGLTKYTNESVKRTGDSRKGKHLSEYTKNKISESNKGKKVSNETRHKLSLANTGKTHSEETRSKLRLASTGRSNGPLSQETKLKLSIVNRGKVVSQESRNKMSIAKKGKTKPDNFIQCNSKPILQYSAEGTFIKDWSSCFKASKALSVCRQSIVTCLKGRSKSAGGYIWKYKNL